MRRHILKTFADSRKMKYSTLSLAFCAIVIALAIILNSIVSVLVSTFNWYIDMTDGQMFTLSDDAKNLLDDINKEVELEIIFPVDKDKIDTAYATNDYNGSIGHIYKTALEIAQECENIKVSCRDVIDDYEFYYNINLHTYAKQDYILILRKNAEGNYVEGDFRSYPVNRFYVPKSETDQTLYAYNGELVFLSALIAMSRDTVPTVYFTIGHNETNFPTSDQEALNLLQTTGITFKNLSVALVESGLIHQDAYSLMTIFVDSGFTIKSLDTRTKEIPSDARMIVINQPKADFTEDELFKFTEYLQNGGAVFCFTPHDTSLPNLYATLESNYGITINTAPNSVEDSENQMTNGSVKHYLANVSMQDEGFASSKYFSAYSSYSSANAYYNKAGTISIDERYMKTDGYRTGAISKFTYPLLETANTATFKEDTGVFNLMSITAIDRWSDEDRSSKFSYLVVCPSSDFASTAALSLNTANRHMILSLIQNTSSVQTPVNLDHKPFVEYKLTIRDSHARTLTVVLATILPALIAISGVVVIVRRKRR